MNKEITKAINNAPIVRLGEFIEENYKQCGELPCYDISGIDINKQFIKSVARISESNLPKYLEVKKGQFASNLMHIGRDVRIPVAYNNANDVKLVSPAYYVFQLKESTTSMVLAEYIQLLFDRYEFDRLAWFYTDSSVRGNLSWDRFCEIEIPLPSIEVQRELIATYEGWLKIAEDNEALIEPLSKACHAYIVDCKEKYPNVKLGDYIEPCDERNTNNTYKVDDVAGISIQKKIIPTKANMDGVSLTSYKVLKPKEFCYVTVTSRNGGKISLAINNTEKSYITSATYIVFKTTEQLMPEYLYLLLSRTEFDCYARFNSWGSARETFDWLEMCRVEIPLPPIEVQQAIVSLYHCIEEAKAIAADAREQLKQLCPALVQKAYHTTSNIA